MTKTIKAMQRIDEIRVRRQERFYEKRMQVRTPAMQLCMPIVVVHTVIGCRRHQLRHLVCGIVSVLVHAGTGGWVDVYMPLTSVVHTCSMAHPCLLQGSQFDVAPAVVTF